MRRFDKDHKQQSKAQKKSLFSIEIDPRQHDDKGTAIEVFGCITAEGEKRLRALLNELFKESQI